MGDDLNEQDESLQSLINDLQELRKTNDEDDEEVSDDDPFTIQMPTEEQTYSKRM